MPEFECQVCNAVIEYKESRKAVYAHIRRHAGYEDLKAYYDEFLRAPGEGL